MSLVSHAYFRYVLLVIQVEPFILCSQKLRTDLTDISQCTEVKWRAVNAEAVNAEAVLATIVREAELQRIVTNRHRERMLYPGGKYNNTATPQLNFGGTVQVAMIESASTARISRTVAVFGIL